MAALAKVLVGYGQAVILEDSGAIFLLEHDHSEPKDGSQVNIQMYLQPAMSKIDEKDAGEYPYTELHQYLKDDLAREEGFKFFLYCLDPNLSRQLRLDFIPEAKDALTNPEVEQYVIKRMLETPLPPTAILEGLPEDGSIGKIVKAVKEKWRS